MAVSLSEHEAIEREACLRVVLADDSYLVREALGGILRAADGIEVVASCADGATLIAAVDAEQPDVVVTDIRMPPRSYDEGLQVAEWVRDTYPRVGVVVLSQYVEPAYVSALLDRGSDGRAYLLKDRVRYRGQLISAIETVARGGSMIDAKVIDTLITAKTSAKNSPLGELTERELEILAYVARGLSNQAIADVLVLTKRAVEKHINAIFLKLNVRYALDVSQRVKAALIYLAAVQDA